MESSFLLTVFIIILDIPVLEMRNLALRERRGGSGFKRGTQRSSLDSRWKGGGVLGLVWRG